MKDFGLGDLKSWRKKAGISQKRLSELARVSLATLRQLEIGSERIPHKKTIKKVTSAIRSVEKKIRSSIASDTLSSGAKSDSAFSTSPEKKQTGRGVRAVFKASKKPAGDLKSVEMNNTDLSGKSREKGAAPSSKGSVVITNLDLELINRILCMSDKDKLLLLKELI